MTRINNGYSRKVRKDRHGNSLGVAPESAAKILKVIEVMCNIYTMLYKTLPENDIAGEWCERCASKL